MGQDIKKRLIAIDIIYTGDAGDMSIYMMHLLKCSEKIACFEKDLFAQENMQRLCNVQKSNLQVKKKQATDYCIIFNYIFIF